MLHSEIKNANLSAENEHQRVAKVFTDEVRRKLIEPLQGLKVEINNQVTESYVQKQFDQARKAKAKDFKLELPPQLHVEFERTMDAVRDTMAQQNTTISTALEGLRADYSTSMAKHTGQIASNLQGLNIKLPTLNVSFDLDFSNINDYDEMKVRLQQQMDEQRDLIEQAENELLKNQTDPTKIQTAREALQRAERQIQGLGSRPTVRETSRRVAVSRDGFWGGVKDIFSTNYETRYSTDDSQGRSWDEDRQKLNKQQESREKALERIQAEEQEKSGKRLSQERLVKKYDQQMREAESKLAKAEQQSQANRQELIAQALSSLTKSTAGEINKRMTTLQGLVVPAIEQAFTQQLQLLKGCVEEQFMQPMQAKLQQRQEIAALMAKETSQIEQRKVELANGLKDLLGLHGLTDAALHTAH